MEPDQRFSRRLAVAVNTAILDSGRTQADIATVTGITGSVLNARLKGNVPLRANELHAIAAALHINVADLITQAEDDAA